MTINGCQNFLNLPNEQASLKTVMQEGARNALGLVRRASEEVPAYRDFLARHGVNGRRLSSIEDLESVPTTSKKNYIEQYSLEDRCWGGSIRTAHAIAASSGSTGTALFWPRAMEQEFEGALIHQRVFCSAFGVRQGQSTLFVNALALGNWIAGMYTQHCVHLLQLRGLALCVANPGYSEQDTLTILERFAPQFDQTIVAGHPPFLRMLLQTTEERKWPLRDYNLRLLGAGEGISESSRDFMLKRIGALDPIHSFINIYGSADAGLMAFETPLSIACKRVVERDESLSEQLLPGERAAYFYQFDPRMKYLQVAQGTVVVTANGVMPLIRYDIRDEAVLLPWNRIEAVCGERLSSELREHGATRTEWELPMLAIFGRKDVAVSLYAINLFPELFKHALDDERLASEVSGRFIARKSELDDGRDQLVMDVELRRGVIAGEELAQRIGEVILTTLREKSSEFRRAYETLGALLAPRVRLHSCEDPLLFPPGKPKKLA